MPILNKEDDLYPSDLFEKEDPFDKAWLFYIMSRREKEFMRRLLGMKIAFYGPMVEKKYRSPNGRFRTSFVPLFSNYVFVFGTEQNRYDAMTTSCVSKYAEIVDQEQLLKDLRQVRHVLNTGEKVTAEQKLDAGNPILVKNGPFKGFEGYVIRREHQTRLLVYVNFIEQGVSVEIDESQLQPI